MKDRVLQTIVDIGLLIDAGSSIGKSLTFESPVWMRRTTLLRCNKIGAFTYVGPGSEIRDAQIGRFCSLAPNVAIGPAEHPVKWVSSHPIQFNGLNWFKEAESGDVWANPRLSWRGNAAVTRIGHDVWIGRNAVIRQGVTIGHGAIIGANAYVNRDVDPYAIVGGVPARPIRLRFPQEIVEQLLELCWWDWMPPQRQSYSFDDVPRFVDQFHAWRGAGLLRAFVPRLRTVTVQGKSVVLEPAAA